MKDAKGFVDVAGIESPGLTSAPAIGKMVSGIVAEMMQLEEKTDFIPNRKGIVSLSELDREAQKKLIEEKPEYGNIICRCEMLPRAKFSMRSTISGCPVSGRCETPYPCRYGSVSGRVLFTENHGDSRTGELHVSLADITKCGGEFPIDRRNREG